MEWREAGVCQFSVDGDWRDWNDGGKNVVTCEKFSSYRRKPESNLRPWKPEESVGKIIKHKVTGAVTVVTYHRDDRICLGYSTEFFPLEKLEEFEQLDGKPCGVEE